MQRDATRTPDPHQLDTSRAMFRVEQTDSGLALPAVTVSAFFPGSHFQDYLTPDQADSLADSLKAHAAHAREHA